MLIKLAAAFVIVIGAVLAFAATRPDHFRIERSITIQSAPEHVFPHISHFRAWEAWSPWEKLDSQIQKTYSGTPEGKGAIYEWSGNKDVGKGRMEITDAVAPSRLTIQLDFITPFEAHNTVDFVLTPEGNSTRVTQAMHGPSPFVSKLMGLFFSIDKMVGDKYEEGLSSLKRVVETPAENPKAAGN